MRIVGDGVQGNSFTMAHKGRFYTYITHFLSEMFLSRLLLLRLLGFLVSSTTSILRPNISYKDVLCNAQRLCFSRNFISHADYDQSYRFFKPRSVANSKIVGSLLKTSRGNFSWRGPHCAQSISTQGDDPWGGEIHQWRVTPEYFQLRKCISLTPGFAPFPKANSRRRTTFSAQHLKHYACLQGYSMHSIEVLEMQLRGATTRASIFGFRKGRKIPGLVTCINGAGVSLL